MFEYVNHLINLSTHETIDLNFHYLKMVSKSRKRREEKRSRRKSAGKTSKKSPKQSKDAKRNSTTTPDKATSSNLIKSEQLHHYNTRLKIKIKKALKIDDQDLICTETLNCDEIEQIQEPKLDSSPQKSECSFDYQNPASPLNLDELRRVLDQKLDPSPNKSDCSFDYEKSSSPLNFERMDSSIEFNLEKDISLTKLDFLEAKILADEEDSVNDNEKENSNCIDELPTNGNLKNFLKFSSKLMLSKKTKPFELISTNRPLTPTELDKLTKDTNCVLAGPFKFNPNLLKEQTN